MYLQVHLSTLEYLSYILNLLFVSPVWQFREVHVREVDCAEAFDVCPAKRNRVQKDLKKQHEQESACWQFAQW